MRFTSTDIPGVWEIELDLRVDERGWFARTFDPEQFAALGVALEVAQANSSFNARAGTLRGLHYQLAPVAETKLVRCVTGAIYDVAVDLRPASPAYCRWHAAELSAQNARMLLLPDGVAHGFQTLQDASEVLYLMGAPYSVESARGVRWDDPAFAVEWPAPPSGGRVISERDRSFADYEP